jgi:ribonuclease E
MKSLMPSHARKVKLYKDPTVPLFYRHQVEGQIDSMHNATVQLKSGGYIVINMTEALVAIDVNSGKATRERHIEETAYKTNLEAAEEVARQQRLRDLAGLIVIDFIDMEESRHNRAVERKLKEAMRLDRARIQLGRISPFGLLEMSRQRLRPSLFESSTVVCPNCNASGYVRTTESMALHVLRGLEEEGIRRGSGDVLVTAPPAAALHLLNRMRDRIVEIEHRYGFQVRVEVDEALIAPSYTLERLSLGPRSGAEADEERRERGEDEGDRSERKRGRGRRRRRRGEEPAEVVAAEPAQSESAGTDAAPAESAEAEPTNTEDIDAQAVSEQRAGAPEENGEDKPKRRRRRGKRGGRRRSRRRDEEASDTETEEIAAEAPEAEASEQVAEVEAPLEGEAAEAAESEAPKAKRRRAPRRKKAAAPASDAPAEAAAEVSVDPEAKARPKRTRAASKAKRAPRKKAAAKKAAEPAAEPLLDISGPDPVAPVESPAAPPVAPSADVAPANGDDSPEMPAEAPAEAPVAAPPETEAPAPRRRGWWQKFS